jgi:hypothetical protein
MPVEDLLGKASSGMLRLVSRGGSCRIMARHGSAGGVGHGAVCPVISGSGRLGGVGRGVA